MSDGPTGVRGTEPGITAALLPNATLLASTWDEQTLADVGRILAEGAISQRVHVVLGPTINLHRTPLGGRLFEMYSEDPLLTGRLAAAYVRGLQGHGVGACPKHLVANECETARTTMSSDVDEATLRELYLLPFQIVVEDAHPWTLMEAYNDLNGTPCSEHAWLLHTVLRDEWGWDGVVVSDWGATKSVRAAASGLDLVMPGPGGPWGPSLVDAVRAGAVDEKAIDEHVERLVLLGARVGPTKARDGLPTPAERRDELTILAAAGMTVLTNNGVLPLAPDADVALIGRHALETIGMGGGSAEVGAPYVVPIAEGVATRFSSVCVVDGVEVRERLVAGNHAMHLTLLRADGTVVNERDCPHGKELISGDVARAVFTARVELDGPAAVGVIGVGAWKIDAGGTLAECALTSPRRTLGEESLAPPTQRVAVAQPGDTITAEVDIRAHFGDAPVWGRWGLSIAPVPVDDDVLLAQAAAASRDADVAVVVVGLTEERETEGADKHTLALPGRQDEMVRLVAAAAKRTVVVVNAATPVLMPWLDEVDAVLWAGFPGQEAGHAVAAALVGAVEPAGRLTTTFPAADGATPAWSVEPVDGHLAYDEGPFVGYRGHAAGRAPVPLFWFGHGLGYSDFEYGDVAVDGDVVHVTIRNAGGRPSREVVQVYFQPDDASQPVRLAGWAAAVLDAGQSTTVDVQLDRRALQRWTDDRWTPLGAGEFVVARGLGDVRARLPTLGLHSPTL